MTEMIWWVVLIVSGGALLIILPYTVLLLADEVGDHRETVYLMPQERNETPRLPMAKLSGREYRRIIRETERTKKAARARRCSW